MSASHRSSSPRCPNLLAILSEIGILAPIFFPHLDVDEGKEGSDYLQLQIIREEREQAGSLSGRLVDSHRSSLGQRQEGLWLFDAIG